MGIFGNDEHNLLPKLTYTNSNKMIVWPNGSPPKDAPICGFEGEFCLQVKNHYLPKQTIKILKILKKIYYRLDFYQMTILKRPTVFFLKIVFNKL